MSSRPPTSSEIVITAAQDSSRSMSSPLAATTVSKSCTTGLEFKEPATIGLLTSESPDSVAAWRGKKRRQLYGKPILACDKTARVLVLPEPVYMLWPSWMRMVPPVKGSKALDVSEEEEESPECSTAIEKLRRRSSVRDKDLMRVSRSSYNIDPAHKGAVPAIKNSLINE